MSAVPAPPRHHRTGGAGGFTLPELLVAMTLAVILSVVAFGAVAAFLSAVSGTSNRLDSAARGQLFLDRVTQEIRAAVPAGSPSSAILYADPDHITFYSGAATFESGTGPRLVDIALSNGVITETVKAADPLSGPGGWTWTGAPVVTITTSMVDATHTSLFSYYPAGVDPTAPAVPALSTPMTQASSSTPTSMIDSITVDLWTRQSANSPTAQSTEVTSVVHLRNVDYAQTPY